MITLYWYEIAIGLVLVVAYVSMARYVPLKKESFENLRSGLAHEKWYLKLPVIGMIGFLCAMWLVGIGIVFLIPHQLLQGGTEMMYGLIALAFATAAVLLRRKLDNRERTR